MKNEIYEYLKKIISDLKSYQFKTFLIAFITGQEKNKEKEKERKILLGNWLQKRLKKEVDFKNPDILIEIFPKDKKINYQIKPLYFFGWYQKLKPGIPQTKWHIKRYETSVEEEIGKTLLKITGGSDHSFHGCGREDVDVITIGQGRPFVIEIKNPKKRRINLKKTQVLINKSSRLVKVRKLSYTKKEKIIELKLAQPDKIYQVEIILEKPTPKNELNEAGRKLSNIIIEQQTPIRVLERRYDKLRKKKIYYFKLIKYHPIKPVFEVKSESGTYIKELIHGDNGRTKPSLAKILNQKIKVEQLIVKKIIYDDK